MSVLDGAIAVGPHVVLAGDAHMRRCVTIGVRETLARWAIFVESFKTHEPKREALRQALIEQCSAEGDGVPHLVEVRETKEGSAVIFDAPAGVSLFDVVSHTETYGAVLDAPTAVHALMRATRAAGAPRVHGRTLPPAPFYDAPAIRLGWGGEVCMLGHLPGWPAPERRMMHAWYGLAFLVERLSKSIDDAEALRAAATWIGAQTSKLSKERLAWDHEPWLSAADRLEAAADELGHVDATRIAEFVRGLFPERARAEEQLADELMIVSDDALRAVSALLPGRT